MGWYQRRYVWGLRTPIRRYRVGYALACGNTFETAQRPFFTLSMAERWADREYDRLSRHYHTFAVFVTDLEDPERGDVYGSGE
jgi:hypothetical protein